MLPDFQQHYQPRRWLSISALTSCARCPRRYFYGSGCRLTPTGGEHAALAFGQAIHAAVPWILAKRDLNRAWEEFSKVWDEALKRGITPDTKNNASAAKMTLIDYAETHRPGACLFEILSPPEGDIKISDDTSPWEIPWALDIGLDVPLVGRIDALCTHRDTKELFGLEFKTSSEVSARLMNGFAKTVQNSGYTLALRTYTNAPVAGMMMDIIGKKKEPETMTQPMRVQNHQLEEFVKWARFWGEFILHCEKSGEFPQWETGCSPYSMFGMPGYVCEYKQLCDTPDWRTMLPFFTKREDRPFDIQSVKAVAVPQTT